MKTAMKVLGLWLILVVTVVLAVIYPGFILYAIIPVCVMTMTLLFWMVIDPSAFM